MSTDPNRTTALLRAAKKKAPAGKPSAGTIDEAAASAGRPRELEHPEKVTVILERRHTAFLAQYMATMRARGVKLQRAEIIRELVEALERGAVTLKWDEDPAGS